MRRPPWLSFILFLLLCFSFNAVSSARDRHSSVTLVGTISCNTCSKATHVISGAMVAVECGGNGLKSFQEEVKTNKQGEFEAKLPVTVGENVDRIKRCSVKLVSSSEPDCAVADTATSSEIRFISNKAGTHVFSAGDFTFKPEACTPKDFGFLQPNDDDLPPIDDWPPFPPFPPLPPWPPEEDVPPPSPPPPPSPSPSPPSPKSKPGSP